MAGFGFIFAEAPIRRQPRHLQEQSQLVKDIHWLLELPDEIDILVSEREFEAAVTQIEKGSHANSLIQSLIYPHSEPAF